MYPFAGGDLSTALTVYPDADEITTMSLEPAGDPRTLERADQPGKASRARAALGTVAVRAQVPLSRELLEHDEHDRCDARRPAADAADLRPVRAEDPRLRARRAALLQARRGRHDPLPRRRRTSRRRRVDVRTIGKADCRNRMFANAEIRFRKPGGRIQIYRHIQVNLDNDHLEEDPRVIKHLEAKGQVAGDDEGRELPAVVGLVLTMRDYLTSTSLWMVSDATGVAPKWGKPAGFEYETYGDFVGPHIEAGNAISKDWRAEFDSRAQARARFRFGYYDKKAMNHLIIMQEALSNLYAS